MINNIHSVSIIIPAFNEEALIETAVRNITAGIEPFVSRYELIIVDDGSTDATVDSIRAVAADDKRIKVVCHDRNMGKGAALAHGFARAQMEWVLFTDADMQIDISHIDDFLSYTGEHDVVIGYRTIRSDSLFRRLMSKAYGQAAYALLGLPVRDAHCPFKLFRRSVIEGMTLKSRGFLIDTELLCLMKHEGYRVKELPVVSRPRTKGSSHLKPRHFAVILREFIALLMDERVRRTRW